MPPKALSDMRWRQVNDLQPDIATFMMARAMAEMFHAEPGQPIPEPLAAILRQMESWEEDYGQDAA